ncbi:MAG: hypothetical protein NTV49_07520 [Kiritimatiellaeota bacterium]|nr:hypothetical protein [Kiritimatiellota bacterium]
MVFSSHLFLFYFLPMVLALYYLAPVRVRNLLLTLVSYFFYGWANPLFVVLLLFSTLVDYLAGLVMATTSTGAIATLPEGGPRTRRHKAALVTSLLSNLLLLGFFKYFNFAADSYNTVIAWLGLSGWHLETALRVTLPLGISFYTFQSMSYIIDVYWGRATALRNFTDYACFVSMFPQLVAGPIIRFTEVAAQLSQRTVTLEIFGRGVAFFAIGFAKKILLANPCGKIADTVFNGGAGACLDAWYGVCAYAFQIYFDFSGYSDMAIGLGLMLGFIFPKNFDAPYRSRSLTEFWRRWHISLSSWLKDYLYIPLGGNRGGEARTLVNLMLTMLLGGLWHGAAWNFVAWGALHGLLLLAERLRGRHSLYERVPPQLQIMITFVLVLFTWVFFRASDVSAAWAYCGRMLGLGAVEPGTRLIRTIVTQPYYLLTFVAAAGIVWLAPQTWDWTRRLTLLKILIVFGLLGLAILMLNMQAFNPFIYFIF